MGMWLVLLVATKRDGNILMDRPMNMPAIPAMPTDMILVIGTRERLSSTNPRLCAFKEVILTPFEWVPRSCSTSIRAKRCNPMNKPYQK